MVVGLGDACASSEVLLSHSFDGVRGATQVIASIPPFSLLYLWSWMTRNQRKKGKGGCYGRVPAFLVIGEIYVKKLRMLYFLPFGFLLGIRNTLS